MDIKLGLTKNIINYAAAKGILRNQLAYILATALWETNHTMMPVREAYWLSEKWRKNNLRYYPWYGRGLVQLTWEFNYIRAGKAYGADYTSDPDAVMKPGPAVAILVDGSMEGWFTGKKIPDYISLTKSDFWGARRVINGTDKASKIAALAKQYDDWLKDDLKYGEEGQPAKVDVTTPVAPSVAAEDKVTPTFWQALAAALARLFTPD